MIRIDLDFETPFLSGTVAIDMPDDSVLPEQFVREVFARKAAEAVVLVSKQNDYGPYNIARPPAGISPQQALLVRVNDKVQRLGNLEGKEGVHESKDDSWLDLANYGTIGSMVEGATWPGLATS